MKAQVRTPAVRPGSGPGGSRPFPQRAEVRRIEDVQTREPDLEDIFVELTQ